MVSSSLPIVNRQLKITPSMRRGPNQPSGLQDSFNIESQPVGRMVHPRGLFQRSEISEETTSLLLSSWRHSISKNYDSSWRLWERWCIQNGILNFWQHNSWQARDTALSSILPPIDGFDVGCHHLVCRILFQLRPSKAKYMYASIWSVDQVLSHLASWGEKFHSLYRS